VENCTLCESQSVDEILAPTGPVVMRYLKCRDCDLIHLDPNARLSLEIEKSRYMMHENDITQIGYRKSMQPLIDAIVENASKGATGLDFGSGPTPALCLILNDLGFKMDIYDPFFAPLTDGINQKTDSEIQPHSTERNLDQSTGQTAGRIDIQVHPEINFGIERKKYDFVAVCEVVEHFSTPKNDFEKLQTLLRPSGGLLALKTSLHHQDLNFVNWHYRRDPTHVSFYSEKTFSTICDIFGFRNLTVKNNQVVTMTI
jgi:SAM-dependent methyltransferase